MTTFLGIVCGAFVADAERIVAVDSAFTPQTFNAPDRSSTCFLHIGTHKTGTTSVQDALTANDAVLAGAGLYVPRAARLTPTTGHHNLAWELNEDRRFDAARGTFADVLGEIAQQSARRVCLSSEDFEYLHARPRALRTLADGFRAIGYRPVAIVYLRPQADYAESLYAELVRHGLAEPFEAFLRAIIATGEYRFAAGWRFAFDYERLLDNFAAAFGAQQIIARRYEGGAGDVVADFLRVVGAATPELQRRISGAPRLHAGLRCADVLGRLQSNLRSAGAAGAPPPRLRASAVNGRFDPVHLPEVRRISARFNAGNRRVSEKYGTRIPCVSGRDLLADVAGAVGLEPASSYRKRLVDAQAPLQAAAAAPVPPASPVPERRGGAVFAPAFARPALLEGAILGTAALVAFAALVYGWQTASTALVEFGMLSAIVAASAIALLIRYAVESRGIVADDRYFDDLGARLSLIGYATVGAYALVNAVLDVEVPRYEPDWISYPGTIATAAAALILTLVLPARRRLLGEIPQLREPEDLQHDRLYLACCYIILVGQLAHAISPVWWLDTTVDLIFVALAAFTANGIARAKLASAR